MLSSEDKTLLDLTYGTFARSLDAHYVPGFGIFPSSDPASNYFDQVWARDAAHAAAHYFARAKPEAVIDSLRTILAHQLASGALPSRVERQYQKLRLTPGLRWLSRTAFNAIEGRWHKRTERPIHEGMDSAGGEDTIPAVLIMAGELFDASREDGNGSIATHDFLKENFEKLARAAEFFRATKTDPADGLAVMTRDNPDWADTIKRHGKLGLINILWWRGLRHMEEIAEEIGGDDERSGREKGDDAISATATTAKFYRSESEKVRGAIMEKLYVDDVGGVAGASADAADANGKVDATNVHEGNREVFFRAEAKDDRLDTAASIFGAAYFLDADGALAVERTLARRVERANGLQNFDPPYAHREIFWAHRAMGQWIYHNEFVWPWVTLQNIHVKIKIARGHADANTAPMSPAIREQYQREAVADLVKMARLFRAAGGAYEVFEPDAPRPGRTRWYHPPQNFMGSMAAYQGAYAHLKKKGWI